MELSEKAKELYDLLYTDQFDEAKLRNALETGHYSEDDVNTAALWYVEDCDDELWDDPRWNGFTEDYDWSNCPYSFGTVFPEFKSSHMYEAIRVLLEYGLNPNGIYPDHYNGKTNIMEALRFFWNGYIGADVLYLLLENGGTPIWFWTTVRTFTTQLHLICGFGFLMTKTAFDLTRNSIIGWFLLDSATMDIMAKAAWIYSETLKYPI